MHKPPGNVCCHFFNFPVRLRRTLRWCGSNCSHSTTASSIEIWPSCVNRSIKCRRACPMDVGSPLPCAQPVAFFLRRRCPKYRDTLLIPAHRARIARLLGLPACEAVQSLRWVCAVDSLPCVPCAISLLDPTDGWFWSRCPIRRLLPWDAANVCSSCLKYTDRVLLCQTFWNVVQPTMLNCVPSDIQAKRVGVPPFSEPKMSVTVPGWPEV